VPEEPPWPAALERGEAGAPLAGETRSGDRAVFVPYDGGALVAAIDGLGHGGAAADASEVAAEVLREHAQEPPEALLKRCHRELRSTRGVVATLAWFDLGTGGLTWTGIGNVEGRLVRADRRRGDSEDSPTLFGGVLGWSLPAIRLVRTELAPGDCLVMATDGVAADFGSSLMPGVPAPEQARRVLASHARGSDDALVVAVRYLGEG
jgi:negative regulator of sigma-B (phosphoserine phosphatase)